MLWVKITRTLLGNDTCSRHLLPVLALPGLLATKQTKIQT
jgi:hypothetical protein